jgi:hypothetical protein
MYSLLDDFDNFLKRVLTRQDEEESSRPRARSPALQDSRPSEKPVAV